MLQDIFRNIITVSVSSEKINLAREFALAVTETVNYSDSNQYIKDRIVEDHFISKIGEEAAATVLRNLEFLVAGPDYTIYMGDYKSWEADLKVNGVEVAVKTQKTSSAKKYGLSWTFQSSGKRRDPILDKPDAWVIFVECNDDDNYSCKVFPPKQMKELELKDPQLPHLKGKKKVYYYSNQI